MPKLFGTLPIGTRLCTDAGTFVKILPHPGWGSCDGCGEDAKHVMNAASERTGNYVHFCLDEEVTVIE